MNQNETRVVNVRCKHDVYIGRPSIFGNPWSSKDSDIALFRVESPRKAIENYRRWLYGVDFFDVEQERRILVLQRIPDIVGKTLGCWCKPGPCHGDVLADLAMSYVAHQLKAS